MSRRSDQRTTSRFGVLALQLCSALLATAAHGEAAPGPLRKPPDSIHFVGPDGEPVLLSGIHHGWELVDYAWGEERAPAFEGLLDRTVALGLNLLRLWTVEHTGGEHGPAARPAEPMPFVRSGPGAALDGAPRFDLERLDPRYFDRLEQRVRRAGERGVYVIVMLFQGVSVWTDTAHWQTHYLNRANNVQNLDGDTDRDGYGVESHRLGRADVLAVQERYVEAVVGRLARAPNVLYEIANEDREGSLEWQLHWMRRIRQIENELPLRHPVGLTFRQGDGTNAELLRSGADWVSIRPDSRREPPPATTDAVSILDTDHFWTKATDPRLAWRVLTRGHSLLILDSLTERNALDPARQALRSAAGNARRLGEALGLAELAPASARCGTGFCLATDSRLVTYLPHRRGTTVRLGAGSWQLAWLDVGSGRRQNANRPRSGSIHVRAPRAGGAQGWMLLAERVSRSSPARRADPPPRSAPAGEVR